LYQVGTSRHIIDTAALAWNRAFWRLYYASTFQLNLTALCSTETPVSTYKCTRSQHAGNRKMYSIFATADTVACKAWSPENTQGRVAFGSNTDLSDGESLLT